MKAIEYENFTLTGEGRHLELSRSVIGLSIYIGNHEKAEAVSINLSPRQARHLANNLFLMADAVVEERLNKTGK